jgi:hypothetical protein
VPRTLSWLPRLHLIARSDANSVRSHYDRHDLEGLFELQPRAAQKLLEMLPGVQVGTSRLVDREVLAGFLDRVREADDVPALYEKIRAEKAVVSRRKPRSLVRRDLHTIGIDSLPSSIVLSRGRLYALARVLEAEGEEFVALYEVAILATEH